MERIPVSIDSLSSITYQASVSPEARYPKLLIVEFSGEYRSGGAGKPDATFIMAIMNALQRAWPSKAIVIDFRKLSYQWGDEMEWVYGIGSNPRSGCNTPLSIIVGAQCEQALQSLCPDSFSQHCVETEETASDMIDAKIVRYQECMNNWRKNPR